MVKTFQFLSSLIPAVLRVDGTERARAALGAGIGILVTALVSHWLARLFQLDPWLAAPIGASAVLVFALPASPLAQPWAVIGGNTLSALVGIVCAWAFPDLAVAASVAVAAAIAVMFFLRCLHPPGGATALLMVLMHVGSMRFALMPILLNSILLVAIGALYNTFTGRRYPHSQIAPPPAPAGSKSRFSKADLDAALLHYNQVLDVSRDDLENLLHHTESAAYRRNLGELRCADIMSKQPISVNADTLLTDAWQLMQARSIKALPVVDISNRIVGIVTLADFVRNMIGRNTAPGQTQPAPERIAQIMTRRVRVASEQLHVIELLPLFSEGGHHHLPIVDEQKTLVGIITQSDLVRALHRAVRPD